MQNKSSPARNGLFSPSSEKGEGVSHMHWSQLCVHLGVRPWDVHLSEPHVSFKLCIKPSLKNSLFLKKTSPWEELCAKILPVIHIHMQLKARSRKAAVFTL